MATNRKVLMLPGDGIGPEVMTEVRKVIDWFAAEKGLAFEVEEDLVGGAAYDVHGKPLADETMEKAQAADAVLLGRPYLYGLALGGQEGVEHVLRCLLAELDLTMGNAGCSTLADLVPDLLTRSPR